MTKNFEFSIVMLIHNSELFLKNAVDSVINQNIGFKDNIQLILVVNHSVDDSLKIALEYQKKYPEKILVLKNDNNDCVSSYNLAIEHIKGKYVNFFEACDYFSLNVFKTVKQAFDKFNGESDIVSVPISYLDDEDILEIEKSKECLIDLNKNYKFSNILLKASFIKSDLLDDIEFPDAEIFPEDKFLINTVLINKSKVIFVKDAYYYSRKSKELEFNLKDAKDCFNKLDIFDQFIDTSMDKFDCVPKFLQYNLMEEFSYFTKFEDLEKIFNDKKDCNIFLNRVNHILSYFDENIIINHDLIQNYVKNFFIYLKNNDFHIEANQNEILVKTGNHVINNMKYNVFNIDIVELTNNFLNFTGSITNSCNPSSLSVIAIKKDNNGKETVFAGKYSEYPTTVRKKKTIFNIDWEFSSHYDFSIPIDNNDTFQIEFKLIYNENNNEIILGIPIDFREFAGLSNSSNYFIKHSKIVLFRKRTFYCMPYSFKEMLKLEFKTFIRILKNHESYFMKALIYRFLYLILFIFMKNKRIWLFVDRVLVADDNAEFLYKYCIKKNDGIKKYFIIDKNSADYKRLKASYPNIIPFGSLKHKLLYLFSEKIMSSQLTRRIINPFSHKNSYLYEGVSTYDFCFLQHGVILHDLSSWIRKYNKNLYLFVTSADAERDSIVNGHYNYDANRVQVLGLSRYDNLENNPKKEILFIPTWRRNLDSKEDIINSDYLTSLNSFLNNKKLINYATDHGYSLAFRPHPDLWKFVDLFKINEKFRIADESYQQLFKTSSLMITDYSSVAFDFAYLKKPIIYYHRETFDEFHYNKGYFDYEKMGFGEVVKTEEDLVNKIIEYIDTDCIMENEYKSRVEGFFKFNDKNNCKRIYEWLINH